MYRLSTSYMFHFLLLLLACLLPSTQEIRAAYSDHCSSIVAESIPIHRPINSRFFDFSAGYVIAGSDNVFSSQTPSHISSNSYFRLYISLVLATNRSDVLQITAYLLISTSETAHFDLLGFWSETTGRLCMVGSRLSQSKRGDKVSNDVVLRLGYTRNANITTSLITGIMESLDSVDSPGYFGSISLLASPQRSLYEYTLIDKASESCARLKVEKDTLSFESSGSSCLSIQSYLSSIPFKLNRKVDCSGRNCPLFKEIPGFSPGFFSLRSIECTEDGKLRLHIRFSESSKTGYGQEFVPGMSLIGEGFWDDKRNSLCVIACHVLVEKSSGPASVGDCSIGMSLWFESKVTLKNRGTVAGLLWSNNNEKDDGYFDIASFENLAEEQDVILPALTYKYTESDTAKESCVMSKDQGTNIGNKLFPSRRSVNDMEFNLVIEEPASNQIWAYYAKIISIGDVFYGETNYIDSEPNRKTFRRKFIYSSRVIANTMEDDHEVWNITYKLFSKLPNANSFGDMYVEGIYNIKTGQLCMTGCRYVKADTEDCRITVEIQLAKHLKGTITSRRSKVDPLYFDTLQVSSHSTYTTKSAEFVATAKFEMIMFITSVTFSCICIIAQLLHVKKHPEVLPSISILMMVILTLCHMIPLLLNSSALLFQSQSKSVEVNQIIKIVLEMISFLLHLRLLQQTYSSKTQAEFSKGIWIIEKETMMLCLFLYLGGGLLVTWIHSSFVSAQVLHSNFKGELWNYLAFLARILVDGFLFPQILLNLFLHSNCCDKRAPLLSVFFIGTTVVRAATQYYGAYIALNYIRVWKYMYYSSEYIITAFPWIGVLFAVMIFLQQRSGGQ